MMDEDWLYATLTPEEQREVYEAQLRALPYWAAGVLVFLLLIWGVS